MQISRRNILGASAAFAASVATHSSFAQAGYPDKLIKFIVPLPAGGGIDAMARIYADALSKSMGQPFVVEPRPGGNGMIGAMAVARSPADGYTFLFSNSGILQSSILAANQNFKIDDLAPVMRLANAPVVLGIDANLPAKTAAEFIQLVKANPKKYSFSTYGFGSSSHLLGEMLNRLAGTEMLAVPYAGESAAIVGFLSGQVNAMMGSPAGMAPHAAAGKLRFLAVANPRRLAAYPDIPTFEEIGFPRMNVAGWAGVLAPAGTPKEIIARMSKELAQIAERPEVHTKVANFGFEPVIVNSADFAASIKSDQQKWVDIIKLTNFKPN